MNCQAEQVAPNKWECPVCGFSHSRRFYRPCRGESVEARVWRWVETINPTAEERVKIDARLAVCLNGCEHVTGGVCDDWPNECKRWEIWMNRLAFGSCSR